MARANGRNEDEGLEGAAFRELRLLEEVDATADLSQRTLAGNVGIALGVVNVLVKSMVKRGYIRATRLSWKRWAYFLTPAGVSRKVQLTANYIDRFMDHYRRVRVLVRNTVDLESIEAHHVVAIYGATELGELIYLVLKDAGVEKIEFLDEIATGNFLGTPIYSLNGVDVNRYVKVMVAYPNDMISHRDRLIAAGVQSSKISSLLDNPMQIGVPEIE
jgi:DNA-binding MarR family transcriptional regulator